MLRYFSRKLERVLHNTSSTAALASKYVINSLYLPQSHESLFDYTLIWIRRYHTIRADAKITMKTIKCFHGRAHHRQVNTGRNTKTTKCFHVSCDLSSVWSLVSINTN
jgi:hypothetical protein